MEKALIIRKLIEQKGMSTKAFAEKAGLPYTTLRSILERGVSKSSVENIIKICRALGITVEDLEHMALDENLNPVINRTHIPLVGTICAGDGLLAEQNIEEYIYYPFPNKRKPDFALRVKGNSMINAGIEDGDIVYLRRAPWAEYNGQIVAVVVNDDEYGMLKRIRWTEGKPTIKLIPENEEYETIEVLPSEITICGVYMGHFKPERR